MAQLDRSQTEAIVTALFADRPPPRDAGPRPVGAVLADALAASKARHPSRLPRR